MTRLLSDCGDEHLRASFNPELTGGLELEDSLNNTRQVLFRIKINDCSWNLNGACARTPWTRARACACWRKASSHRHRQRPSSWNWAWLVLSDALPAPPPLPRRRRRRQMLAPSLPPRRPCAAAHRRTSRAAQCSPEVPNHSVESEGVGKRSTVLCQPLIE